MAAERLGGHLVGEGLARQDLAAADAGDAVHRRAVDTVEVHRVRVGAVVDEHDAEAVTLVAAEGRAGHLTVVGPGREKESRGDLDLPIDGDDLPLADDGAVGHRRRLAVIEGGQERHRVDPHRGDVDVADRGRRSVPLVRSIVLMPPVVAGRRRAVARLTTCWQQQRKRRGSADDRRPTGPDSQE
jgi:hypothetical protein